MPPSAERWNITTGSSESRLAGITSGPVQTGGGYGCVNGRRVLRHSHGTAQNDTIRGMGGNDSLVGQAGNDTLYGNTPPKYALDLFNHDHISGGVGNDLIYGNGGPDEIAGDGGNDTLYGDDGPSGSNSGSDS